MKISNQKVTTRILARVPARYEIRDNAEESSFARRRHHRYYVISYYTGNFIYACTCTLTMSASPTLLHVGNKDSNEARFIHSPRGCHHVIMSIVGAHSPGMSSHHTTYVTRPLQVVACYDDTRAVVSVIVSFRGLALRCAFSSP